MNGFIMLDRQVRNWSVWKKPWYYKLIFLHLLLGAAFCDMGYVKRGQVKTNVRELKAECASGKGASRTEITSKQLAEALEFFQYDFFECPMEVEKLGCGELLITFLEYDEIASAHRTKEMRSKPKKEENHSETPPYKNKFYKKGSSTNGFNNFEGRDIDYEEILKQKKEEARKLAQAYREEI